MTLGDDLVSRAITEILRLAILVGDSLVVISATPLSLELSLFVNDLVSSVSAPSLFFSTGVALTEEKNKITT